MATDHPLTREELSELVDILLTVGQSMLNSGAASFRVEQTMAQMGLGLGADRMEIYVTPTGIIATAISGNEQRTRVGQRVSVEFSSLSGTRVTGKVTYLYPSVDARTRTLKARVEVPNPRLNLRPGMVGTVLLSLTVTKGVVVPAEAVVQTGTQSYVFLAKGDGVFEPRSVKLGVVGPDTVEVREGVKVGDEVVTSALFLLDSESRLRATVQALEKRPSADGGPP